MATDNTNDPVDPIEALLESGKFDESTDVTELAAALNGTESVPDKEVDPDDVDAGEPADKVDEPDPAQEAAKAEETEDDKDAKGKPFDKNDPLYGALSGTRKALKAANQRAQEKEQEAATLRQQNEELAAKIAAQAPGSAAAVQKAADEAGITDDKGNAVDVATIDLDALREVYDGPIVDAIAALQAANQQQAAVIKDLRTKDVAREKSADELRAEAVQRDIDAVPFLANLQATDPVMWNAAVAVEEGLLGDPEWQGKSRVERFQEVARKLGGTAAKPAPKQDASKTANALRAAAARAAPTSLSELPSGTAPGQSELETLGDLDVTQIAAKMATMTQAQQEAFLERMA